MHYTATFKNKEELDSFLKELVFVVTWEKNG